ncbi:MAG: hypothetical protein FH749_06205 [Firmicutes bacterium]|nr:hypothetical protein [Bacillota bacterium]
MRRTIALLAGLLVLTGCVQLTEPPIHPMPKHPMLKASIDGEAGDKQLTGADRIPELRKIVIDDEIWSVSDEFIGVQPGQEK